MPAVLLSRRILGNSGLLHMSTPVTADPHHDVQLRNLVWATSNHDVYVMHDNCINHCSSLTRKVTKVPCMHCILSSCLHCSGRCENIKSPQQHCLIYMGDAAGAGPGRQLGRGTGAGARPDQHNVHQRQFCRCGRLQWGARREKHGHATPGLQVGTLRMHPYLKSWLDAPPLARTPVHPHGLGSDAAAPTSPLVPHLFVVSSCGAAHV